MDEMFSSTGLIPYSYEDVQEQYIKSQTRQCAWMAFVREMAEKDLSAIWVIQGVENTTRDWQGENYFYFLRISRAQTEQVTITLPPPMSSLSSMDLCRSATQEISHRVKQWVKNIFRSQKR